MKKRLQTLFLVLAVFGLLFLVPSVRAARSENYCFPVFTPDRCISLMQWAENWASRVAGGASIWLLKGMSQVIWLLDRAAAFVFNKSVVDNTWLLGLKSQMSAMFSSVMPGLIRNTAFGGGGLMYVALSIAGLVMMVPFLGAGARFVRPERVLIWGALLSVLFVSGSFGYDFISQVETYRQSLVSGIVQGSNMPLDTMILQPMQAGAGDLGFGSKFMALPPVFESVYFPEPQFLEVTISEGGGFGFGNALIEPPSYLDQRLDRAQLGAFYAVVSVFGAWLLLLTGLTYVLLSFTALVLIVFIFAALPLGFFEVGGQILSDLAGRYFQVVVQSLSLAVLLRWMSGSLGYIVEVNKVDSALIWIVVVVVMSVVTGAFMNGSVSLLRASPQAFGRALGVFDAPSVFATAKDRASSAVSQAAGLFSAGAMLMGRPEAAVIASAVGAAAERSRTASASANAGAGRGNVFAENGFAPALPAPAAADETPPVTGEDLRQAVEAARNAAARRQNES